MPVPVRGTTIDGGLTLSVILMPPALMPTAVGRNVTLTLQVAPGPRGDAGTHVFVCEKSPVVLTAEMLIGKLLALISVRICCALAVPTSWRAKISLEGKTVSGKG